MRGVIYARYSADRQRETSIDDQVRNCAQHAERSGITVTRSYDDKAISGAVRARPGYLQMLADAAAGMFDVLLVDDLSRLSRDDYELKGTLRKMEWQSVRVVGVADGYDSGRKGHKLQASIYGIKNELFLDDLRERTHRGMTGQALKGYNCGGRTYGYRNVPIEDPARLDPYGRPAVVAVRYEIDERQAEVVRQIHASYAAGESYFRIASELNRRQVPSSRGGTWAISAVKVILENEMYAGKLTWNRRVWAKHPETGKRVSKLRSREEWINVEKPELRIVPDEVMDVVRARQRRNRESGKGVSPTASARRYLFSGLLVCAACGSPFVISANHRYGCAGHKTRGRHACGVSTLVSRHIVEDRLLKHVKSTLLAPENFERFKEEVGRVIREHGAAERRSELARQLKAAERVRDNLLEAIKQGIITAATKGALEAAEGEVAGLSAQLERAQSWRHKEVLPRALQRYQKAVENLEDRLNGRVERAREVLRSLIGGPIRIHQREGHLEAELPSSMRAMVAAALGLEVDLRGCGGPQRDESTCVSLAPDTGDYVPRRYRKINRCQAEHVGIIAEHSLDGEHAEVDIRQAGRNPVRLVTRTRGKAVILELGPATYGFRERPEEADPDDNLKTQPD